MPRDGTPTRTKCHAAPRLARVASAGWAAVALHRSLLGLLHRCNVASLHRCVVASVHRCVVASWTPRRDRLAVDRIAVDSRFAVSPPATPITACVRVRVRAGSAHARARACVCQRECMRVCTRSARLGSARLGSARLDSTRLGSAWLAPVHDVRIQLRLSTAQERGAQAGSGAPVGPKRSQSSSGVWGASARARGSGPFLVQARLGA